MMKTIFSIHKIIVVAIIGFFAAGFVSAEKITLLLKEDLSIGVEDGDNNLIFERISSVRLDSAENIYILDWRKNSIVKFDPTGKFLASITLKQGQGPGEVVNLGHMDVSPVGRIFIHDVNSRKVLVFSPEGNLLREFRHRDLQGTSIACLGDEKIVILGLKDNKIFHVFDMEGKWVSSFGEPFDVPSSLSKFKDNPWVRMPLRFDRSKKNSLYIINPHKNEIYAYKNQSLEKIVKGKSKWFEREKALVTSKGGLAFLVPAVYVLEDQNRLFVTFPPKRGRGAGELTLFVNDEPVASTEIIGIPHAIDSQGRLYVVEQENFPRMVRYVVQKIKFRTEKELLFPF